jgi:hypothetical protein
MHVAGRWNVADGMSLIRVMKSGKNVPRSGHQQK